MLLSLSGPKEDKSVIFYLNMIIFNTIKKAEHWVKWQRKTSDYYNEGYDWSVQETFIDGDLVKVKCTGDGCGWGSGPPAPS